MRVFVTGGTGLLGNTVLRQLEAAGHETVALVRGEPDREIFSGLNARFLYGDIRDADTIQRGVADCDAVIHSAGLIHLGWTRLHESMQINRDGTRVIAEACRRYDRKLVHVGTVDTLAIGSRKTNVDESTPITTENDQIPCSYVQSKRAGVGEVLSQVELGLRAAIVHPGFMLGPWDWKPSSGRMMIEVGRAWRPLAPPGGCSLCDSRDVAAGTIAAIDRGGDEGRQFILAGENVTYFELWKKIAERMNSRAPLMPTGPAGLWIAGKLGDAFSLFSGKEGDLNSAVIQMSRMFHWYDSSRAKSELGYAIRNLNETLDDAAKWIQMHHQHPHQIPA
ncbi:hopanoid-associated sugar epimerase [Rhodopirellula maiorica SM1]|uniref:Hopanoid-associated sugar epimerase n=1 Tax=Rhodopirellula maiorica SM1 TaxID=1265738 RepID=M5RNZ4_9BACT|nr:NAD-dependent epimerase/dehydratase family protein [Rhodopirellula maiorica]EMI21053.1 hopanoid-associated sugar epimerase [Rhodopirellula maiorica SM1]